MFILRPVTEQAHRGFLFCVHLGVFRKTSKFKRLCSSRFSIVSASPFAEQANSNNFPFQGSQLCAAWGLSQSKQKEMPFLIEVSFVCAAWAFRRASKFKRPLRGHLSCVLCASGGLAQSKQIQTPFFFEVSCFVYILGPFAEQAKSNACPFRSFLSCVHVGAFRKASKFNLLCSSRFPALCASRRLSKVNKFIRLSSSRFPILHASWGISQSKQIQTPFLLEASYFVCILGPFAEQANSNIFLLEGFLLVCILGFKRLSFSRFPICVHVGAFRRANEFKRLSSSRLPSLCASWGLSQKQANSNAFPLRGYLFCVHLGASSRASKIKCLSSLKFPTLCASCGLSQSKQIQSSSRYLCCVHKQIQTHCLFEDSCFVCILGPFAEQAKSSAFSL